MNGNDLRLARADIELDRQTDNRRVLVTKAGIMLAFGAFVAAANQRPRPDDAFLICELAHSWAHMGVYVFVALAVVFAAIIIHPRFWGTSPSLDMTFGALEADGPEYTKKWIADAIAKSFEHNETRQRRAWTFFLLEMWSLLIAFMLLIALQFNVLIPLLV